MQPSPLAKTVALVSGASRGIGRAIAETLARRGASVAVAYHRDAAAADETVERCRAVGGEAMALAGDLRVASTATELVERCVAHFGSLEVLVNNAALVSEDLLATLDDDALESMLALNVAAVARLTRAAMRPMLRARRGSVITISSVLARSPGAGHAVYAGTKGFCEAFTRAMAAELGRKNIRVNAVAPGIVETEMSQAARALASDDLLARVPLRRFGVPADVAEVVAFLASPEAAYITGAVLPVDGAYRGS